LLGLFTAARLNELCTLTYSQFKEKHGVIYIDLLDGKTESSERIIPIHRDLIKLNFMDFVESKKSGYIFDSLSMNKKTGSRISMATRWFNGYRKQLTKKQKEKGILEGELVPGYRQKCGCRSYTNFHSFRHTTTQSFKQLGGEVEDHVVQFIVGHSQRELTMTYGVYGGMHEMQQLKDTIDKLDYSKYIEHILPYEAA